MKIAALVPAAGNSRRMGRCKQLLPLGDRSLLRHFLETLREGGAQEIILVLAPEGEEIGKGVRDLPVTIAWNRDPDADMASSLRVGLKSLSPDCRGVLTGPADHPLLSPETVSTLIERFKTDTTRAVQPVYRGEKGHPVLFPRRILKRLEDLPTLRDILVLEEARTIRIPVEDPGVVTDVDTPEDYERVKKMWAARKKFL